MGHKTISRWNTVRTRYRAVIYWNTVQFPGMQAHSSHGHYGLVMVPIPAVKCRVDVHWEYNNLLWVRALKVI